MGAPTAQSPPHTMTDPSFIGLDLGATAIKVAK